MSGTSGLMTAEPSFGLFEDSSRWLPFGTSIVWVVDPEAKTVEVSLADGGRAILKESDELTAGDSLPGFRVPVSEIFGD